MARKFRIEQDSMGKVSVPVDALYRAQTQRAVENFPISGLTLPKAMIRALGLIKLCAARANHQLGLLDTDIASAIATAAQQVADGSVNEHFPVDIFQTGSGTSSNMNANEVIASLACKGGIDIHPNDHVNMGQSSNDVFPSAIHIAACLMLHEQLLPALDHLTGVIDDRSQTLAEVVTTGRTHLMDAMPITLQQELSGWSSQIRQGRSRIQSSLIRLQKIAIGGTAVGSAINTHPEFGQTLCQLLQQQTGIAFTQRDNLFEALSCQDDAVEMSGQLKTLAVSLMKISNDLRWMNSGPLAGLGEIELPALQPGSSIMPGKVNPVVPEALAMVCAQVIGNDSTITVAGQSGNFQLNVMQPVIAYNLIQSIELLTNASRLLADKAIAGFSVKHDKLQQALAANPILVTALNPIIGYELGAKIAKTAYQQNRPLLDVAKELSGLDEDELKILLDPARLTRGGNP